MTKPRAASSSVKPGSVAEKPRAAAGRPPSVGTFPRIKTTRIYEEVCARIREQLVSGVLKPGDKLPTERAMAEMFGVSRTVIREAMRVLQMNGLIELRQGSYGGAFVLNAGSQLVTQSFQNMLDLGSATPKTFLEARSVFISATIDLALMRIDAEGISRLTMMVDEIERLTEERCIPERATLLLDLYDEFGRISQNSVVAGILHSTTEVMRTYTRVLTPAVYTPMVVTLRLMLDYLRQDDRPAAIQVMRDLTLDTQRHLLDAIEGKPNARTQGGYAASARTSRTAGRRVE